MRCLHINNIYNLKLTQHTKHILSMNRTPSFNMIRTINKKNV